MSWDINRVVLVGRVAQDIELRHTPSGTPVATLRLAVGGKPRQDNTVDNASFFNVVTWNKAAEYCNKYLHKGDKIAVDGRLEQRTWKANDGTMRSTIEIIAERVEFLSSPASQQASNMGAFPGMKQNNEFIPPDDVYFDNTDVSMDDISYDNYSDKDTNF